MKKEPKRDTSEEHLGRVRRICAALPETMEKLSHGEPTFFVRERVYAMFANNHHNDGHIAVWIPAEPGLQASSRRLRRRRFSDRLTLAGPAGLAWNWVASTTTNWLP